MTRFNGVFPWNAPMNQLTFPTSKFSTRRRYKSNPKGTRAKEQAPEHTMPGGEGNGVEWGAGAEL